MLNKSSNSILQNLDQKYAFILRNHILADYDRYVIAVFKSYIKRHSRQYFKDMEKTVGVEIYNLLIGTIKSNSESFEYVARALMLSDKKLYNASVDELSRYIQNCSKSELIQVAANVKMICSELLWIDEYNSCYEDTFSEVSIKTKENIPMILIKDSESKKIRDRWPLINNESKVIADARTKPSPADVGKLLLIWNNSDSPKSAVEILAKKAGISAAAAAVTSALFS